jgi:hypothetical protein
MKRPWPTRGCCAIEKKTVTYDPATCFDLYKVIIREANTKAYTYSKFCQRCACIVKYNIFN